MPSTILVLCAFLALLAAAVWPAVRCRGAPGQRFRAVLAATTVLLLLVLMLVTTAPRDVTDDGRRYTCIEEPLAGLNPLSSDATDACVQANWMTVALVLLGCAALVTAEHVVVRRRAR
ncbi:hypothetical protein CBR64_11565 [Cellulosimicrobium cellulans]|uniref:Uncharacterized protein n=1 Tax=Cellulosimicrobium cellulans TaxID=1710 RepID=A0A1Y0HWX4_CELCE|nr:hypothetical protein [Cellulosimicrobium cellulans]ARU52016.1 hypothetical protein CBR64_11565 [Cellulosimicrobium cellulans]